MMPMVLTALVGLLAAAPPPGAGPTIMLPGASYAGSTHEPPVTPVISLAALWARVCARSQEVASPASSLYWLQLPRASRRPHCQVWVRCMSSEHRTCPAIASDRVHTPERLRSIHQRENLLGWSP